MRPLAGDECVHCFFRSESNICSTSQLPDLEKMGLL